MGEKHSMKQRIQVTIFPYFICAFLMKPVLGNQVTAFCEEAYAGATSCCIRLLIV